MWWAAALQEEVRSVLHHVLPFPVPPSRGVPRWAPASQSSSPPPRLLPAPLPNHGDMVMPGSRDAVQRPPVVAPGQLSATYPAGWQSPGLGCPQLGVGCRYVSIWGGEACFSFVFAVWGMGVLTPQGHSWGVGCWRAGQRFVQGLRRGGWVGRGCGLSLLHCTHVPWSWSKYSSREQL